MNSVKRSKIIFWTIFCVTLILRVIKLDIPLANEQHNFRQTETAIIIEWFIKEGWDFFNYQMPVLGSPWHIMFECPIYQTIVYFIMCMFKLSNIDMCCKVITLISFYLGVPVIKKIVDKLSDMETSYYVCSAYLISTYTIYWSRGALIDYLSVLFALIYVWGLYTWLDENRIYPYIVGFSAGCLGYLQKSTTMFPYVFLLAFLIIYHEWKELKNIGSYLRNNVLRLFDLAIICVIPVAMGILWVHHADSINAKYWRTEGFASYNVTAWNYGTLAQRFKPYSYIQLGYNLFGFYGIGTVFLAILLIVFWREFEKKNRFLFIAMGSASFLTVMVLFNLYCQHNYYFIAVSPLICACVGIIVYETIKNVVLTNKFRIIAGLLLLAIFIQPVFNMKYLGGIVLNSSVNNNIGLYLNTITEPDERIMVIGEDWNPTTLYYAERKGYMVTGSFGDEAYEKVWVNDNYTTLVTHSDDDAKKAMGYLDIELYNNIEGCYIYKVPSVNY